MQTTIYKANSRGSADYGWLKTNYSFSFGRYYNPERMGFGKLRVINDDTVAAGKGFDTHPHDNMEIITIPLSGDLAHKDSMGNSSVIEEGDIQVMSAGSGIYHSEYNPNDDKEVSLFQIWVIPDTQNVEPRYAQQTISELAKEDELYQILSPNPDDAGVWIHQKAWFHMGDFSESHRETYNLKLKGNGVYVMVIEGEITIDNNILGRRDAIGITDAEKFEIISEKKSRILVMEVPM
jgi:redox-sensitive bicupin YhaK (pirin superfamily)